MYCVFKLLINKLLLLKGVSCNVIYISNRSKNGKKKFFNYKSFDLFFIKISLFL